MYNAESLNLFMNIPGCHMLMLSDKRSNCEMPSQ